MGVIGNQGFWAFSETKGCFGGRKPKLVGVIDKKGLWAWKKPRVVGVIGAKPRGRDRILRLVDVVRNQGLFVWLLPKG